MALHDLRYVCRRNLRVPDVVGVDKDYRPHVVAAGAGVSQDRRRGESAPLDFLPKTLQQLAAALRAATALSGRGANEDLA